eukprot:847222_1
MKTQIELSNQTEISVHEAPNIDTKTRPSPPDVEDKHYTPLGNESHSIIEHKTHQTIDSTLKEHIGYSIDFSVDGGLILSSVPIEPIAIAIDPNIDIKDSPVPMFFDIPTPKTMDNNSVTLAPKSTPMVIDHEWIYEHKHKYRTLCKDFRFFGRTLTLILLLLLLALSIAYCIGKRLSVTLELIKPCTPKEQDDIWHHSYLASWVNGAEGVRNAESQHGLTPEQCWSTDSFDISTEQLWLSNKYVYKWAGPDDVMDYQFVLFVMLALYCLIIIIYDINSIIMDLYHTNHNILHRQSPLYQKPLTPNAGSSGSEAMNSAHKLWNTYMANDKVGWVIRSLVNEITELTLQTNAMLLYNGYNVFDARNEEDIYLAHKPQYIILFAVILAVNAFGSGVLWLSYTFTPNTCYGTMFKLCVFVIDGFSDLFYTVFPLIVIFTDSYNEGTDDIYATLGQLNIDSGLAFCAAFIPLFLLCTQSLLMVRSTRKELRNAYYHQWKYKQSVVKGISSDVDKELYDSEGNLKLANNRTKAANNNWILADKGTKKGRIKQIMMAFIALSFIAFSISVVTIVTKHMSDANAYCTSIREANYVQNGTFIRNVPSEEELVVFERNPELWFWDKCLYQTHPFTSNERLQCQCRAAVIDWGFLESSTEQRDVFNLTQDKILSGMLSNWIMLEKFRTNNVEEGRTFKEKFRFPTTSLYKMKAFEWTTLGIESLQSEVSTWTDLEYLQFKNTPGSLANLAYDFEELRNMKYLSFIDSGLQEFPFAICNMSRLEVVQMEFEGWITSIPHCVGNLNQLQVLLVDGSLQLSDIPLSIFNLPKLILLSITTANIDYRSLLEYNVPGHIDLNDTESVNMWFENHFMYHNDTDVKYWLSQNPMCDGLEDDGTIYPLKLQTLLRNSCDYYCDTSFTDEISTMCFPRLMGNGRCDETCNMIQCNWDDGDCMQLCFAPELTNCSRQDWDFLQHCDEKCDNWYCAGYQFGSTFQIPMFRSCVCDHLKCRAHFKTNVYNTSYEMCYLVSAVEDIQMFNGVEECGHAWRGDGLCDDLCNIEECSYDGGDCPGDCIGNMCNSVYQGWTFLAGPGVYKMDHATACAEMWSTAVALASQQGNLVEQNCSYALQNVDYNNDQHINFREFTALGYGLFGGSLNRATQINCSQCIGMEYYNI